MGASNFQVSAVGKTPEAAFHAARERDLYEFGHDPYSGTIGQKSVAVMVEVPKGYSAAKVVEVFASVDDDLDKPITHYTRYVRRNGKFKAVRVRIPDALLPLVDRYFATYNDKWGDPLCVEVRGAEKKRIKEMHGRGTSRDRAFIFFGWAAS